MKKTLRDLLLYVLIGVGLVAIIFLLVVLVPGPGLTHAWFIFIFMTLFLGLVLVKTYWSERSQTKVWLVLALLMTVHIAAYVLALRRVGELSGAWYLLGMPVEFVAIVAIVQLCTKVLPRKVDL